MAFFKKKQKIEDTVEYKQHKAAAEDKAVEHVNIGGEKTNNPPELPTLQEIVHGMTDEEYRTNILALLVEIKEILQDEVAKSGSNT